MQFFSWLLPLFDETILTNFALARTVKTERRVAQMAYGGKSRSTGPRTLPESPAIRLCSGRDAGLGVRRTIPASHREVEASVGA